jgi:hypothetical protein
MSENNANIFELLPEKYQTNKPNPLNEDELKKLSDDPNINELLASDKPDSRPSSPPGVEDDVFEAVASEESKVPSNAKNITTQESIFDLYCISRGNGLFVENLDRMINDLKKMLPEESFKALAKGMAEKLDKPSLDGLIKELQKMDKSKSETKEEKKNKYAIFFDFDCTLTYIHMSWFTMNRDYFNNFSHWKNYIDQKEKENNIVLTHELNSEHKLYFGTIGRFTKLKGMLDKIKKAGFDIYISSRGNCSDIKKVLTDAGLFDYFTEINANDDNDKTCIKGMKYDYIMDKIKEKGYKLVYYVDDDPAEHNKLITTKLNELINSDVAYYYIDNFNGTQLIKDQNGLTENMMDVILSLCNNANGYLPRINDGMKQLQQRIQLQLQLQQQTTSVKTGGGINYLNEYKKYKHQYKQIKKELFNL